MEQQAGSSNCGTTEDYTDKKLLKELDEQSARVPNWLVVGFKSMVKNLLLWVKL
jgi:hypothetical protein